jgi:hypothetical protein
MRDVVHSSALVPFLSDNAVRAIPRRRAVRLALLDLLANEFEPGRSYPEAEVNAVLERFHPDFCLLRRLLVDEQFLGRGDGLYWRTGGTFEVD